MTAIGTISEFNTTDSWDLYVDQVKFFFEANDITADAKKRATLLAVCGIKTLSILRSLLTPNKPSDKTFDEIVTLLTNHFSPKASEIYCRFIFHKRVQKSNESLTDYITDLRKLAEDCNFGNTLSERLRDQFVCGIQNESIQRTLLSETTLTLDNAVSKAYAAETAANQAKKIHLQGSPGRINGEAVEFIQHQRSKVNQKPKSSFKSKVESNKNRFCYSCGGDHERSSCKFRDAICRNCNKKGHIQKICRAKKNNDNKINNSQSNKNRLLEVNIEKSVDNADYAIHSVNKNCSIPLKEKAVVYIEDRKCLMEVDSGSFYSIISYDMYNTLFPSNKPHIHVSSVQLSDFQKNQIPLKGMCVVKVTHKNFKAQLRLIIADTNCSNILGYEWFQPLGIRLVGVNLVISDPIQKVVKTFEDVFSETLGAYKGPLITLPIDPKIPPVRHKARNVPLAMRPKIDAALDKLLEEGVIEPISNPTWSTPVVPIIKSSGDVRLCGDYKVTLNKAMADHVYPIPSINHLLSNLKGGGYYAKIDLAQAYLQLLVDENSAEAQTIITHRGAYKVKRLQYGIKVAPGLFQNLMDDLLGKLPGVIPYFDDILIRATTLEQLAERLYNVLSCLRKAGLHAKKEKCEFGVTEIEFLGYRVDAKGIHPSKSKVAAIHNAPVPKDKLQLQAFLGLLNFYHSFLPNKASVAEPLHKLLQKNADFKWSKQHDIAFDAVKKLLSSDSVIMPFDENLPIIITCDASPYGIGAVLSHILPDGREAPIAFSSRTLNSTERNYSQLDKEALSIVAAVKKFHHFIYGQSFTVVTDHKPLLGLFNKNKLTPDIISPRMLRWTLILNAYEFELIYRPGKEIPNADALSRLPTQFSAMKVPSPLEVFFLEEAENLPLHACDIARLSAKDPVLSQILNWVLRGWPVKISDEVFQPYIQKQHELSVHKKCLLWGNRVVIPQVCRKQILEELHVAHPGIERMKALARCYVWWPKIDADITSLVNTCHECQMSRHVPPRAPVHHWEPSKDPWSRLHIDFAGPFCNKYFLIVVDSFSKWLEVRKVNSPSSFSTINVLRELFSTHGLPDVIVSDNGSCFTSEEFRDFLKANAIRQVLIPPYHPASNGQAERMVQSFKEAIKRVISSGGTWNQRISSYLLRQHITPSSNTGFCPAELLIKRKPKTLLDRIHPDYDTLQTSKSLTDIANLKTRHFSTNDPVYIKNFVPGESWIPAVVENAEGNCSYSVQTPDGKSFRRHIDHMRRRVPPATNPRAKSDVPPATNPRANSDVPEPPVPVAVNPSTQTDPAAEAPVLVDTSTAPFYTSTPRRSLRKKKPPERFADFVAF